MTDKEILEYALREAERKWSELFEISQRIEALNKALYPLLEEEEQREWIRIQFLEAKISALKD